LNLILYGPPASGKTTVGRALARRLGREFVDTDEAIEARVGTSIPNLFATRGEAAFREIESAVCRDLARRNGLVIACGGGALLNTDNRATLEATGRVICLSADPAELLKRMNGGSGRPLLAGSDPAARLAQLLEARRALYESFALRVDTTGKSIEEVVDRIVSMTSPTVFRIEEPTAYEILLGHGLLDQLPDLCHARDIRPPSVVVTDDNVAPLHGESIAEAIGACLIRVPAGEVHKTLDTIRLLYAAFLDAGVERGATVAALGGGVIGDMTGFAAATYLRGVKWINLPTTLLAMVDASIGGKTGVDLPQGKNLVGAFHMPALVVADLDRLATLPADELRSGMAEVVKAGIIGDGQLFHRLSALPELTVDADIIARAIAVKVAIVQADPFERTGERAKLNLGHTIGHGVEAASGFRLKHGEAIAVGLVAEACIAERMGLAVPGLEDRMVAALQRIDLPIDCPGLPVDAIRAAMSTDKKKQDRRLKFALPVRVGEVVTGVEVDEALLIEVLKEIAHAR
jgi:3-dehydroquinate synthase